MYQYQTSVSEAIDKARWPLKWFPTILLFASIVVGMISSNITKTPSALLLTPLGIIVAIILWYIHSVKWRLWAIDNVKDIHRLYQVAQREQMLTNPFGWWNRASLKWSAQGRVLLELEEERLRAPRILEQVSNTPETIEFKYSRSTIYIGIPFTLFMVGFLVFVPVKAGLLVAFFVLAGAAFMIYQMVSLWQRIQKHPFMIRLDPNGLTIESNSIIPWATITDCHIEIRGTGKHSRHYFTVYTIDNYFEIEVNEMAGSSSNLDDAANAFLSWSRQKK